MVSSQNPIARKDGLVVQEMPEEVLVYDLNTNKAHCLNQTAAFVWKSCDGVNSITDITKLFEDQSGNSVKEELVWLAIDQLSDKDLLENEVRSDLYGQSRREVIKKIGLAAVIALPLVASLTAPTSVMASASCTCGTVADCGTMAGCPTMSCSGLGVCQA